MKDQLLAIAVLLGTAFGLFWIRHLVLTVAKRKAKAMPMNESDDRRGDDFADDEPTPSAWLTTANIESLQDNEFMETAPAGSQPQAKPHSDIPLTRPWRV